MSSETAARPVRKDVARNRALLIRAADEVFAERGVDATLDEIAKHAGVGVATAYRHFENKQALLEALFEDRMTKVLGLLEQTEEIDDPRLALEHFLYGVGEMQAADRGLRESLGADHGVQKAEEIRERLQPHLERLIVRAQQAGVVRPEFRLTDVPVLLWMTSAVSDYAGGISATLWRRYLDFVLDGIAGDGVPRREITVPPMDLDQVETAMREWHQPRTRA